jgi:ubiquinone/menaquinone biosynthesis C-methylase UbiE
MDRTDQGRPSPVPGAALEFLREHVRSELKGLFGVPDAWITRVVDQWFDDSQNYDGRWHFLKARGALGGRILDMAAGCGTFMLYGLRHGQDVYGIEPEAWKREYFALKVAELNGPNEWIGRLLDAVGEALPWPTSTFDVVSCYQTIEHVASVEDCLAEMMRVLKPGGHLHIRAPDYRSFFEPHYRLPFLPRMNRRLATHYLSLMRRPAAGLTTLHWVTEPEVRGAVLRTCPTAEIQSIEEWFDASRRARLRTCIPQRFGSDVVLSALTRLAIAKRVALRLVRFARQEKQMDLWITKPCTTSQATA